MTVTVSKVNYGALMGPGGVAVPKINYGVLSGPGNGVVVLKMNYGVIVDTNPATGRRRMMVNQ